MTTPIKKRSKKAGLPPGTLVHIGDKKSDRTRITLFDYNEQGVEEKEITAAEECALYKDSSTVTWINVTGLHQVEVLEKLNECFGLHPLVLEDILNTDQRPKMEDFGEYLYRRIEDPFLERRSKEGKSETNRSVSSSDLISSFLSRKKRGPSSTRFRNAFATGRAASERWGLIICSTPFWTPLSTTTLSFWKN